jgi:hypothetical protein
MGDNRPSVYTEDGITFYRASSLGGCSRMLVAHRLGYTPVGYEGPVNQVMAEGELHERDVVERMEKDGVWLVTCQQQTVSLPITSNVSVVGHIDGIATNRETGGGFLLEIKSMGKDQYEEWTRLQWETPGLIQRYKWQLSAYMVSLSLPGLLAVKNRNNGTLTLTTIPEPFYSLSALKARIIRLEGFVARGELPPCDTPVFPCPFVYLHDTDEVELIDDTELDELARAYTEVQRKGSVVDVESKGLRDRIRKGVGERRKVETVGGTKVTVYEARSPRTVNYKMMEEDGVLGKYVVEGKTGERMRVEYEPPSGE